MIMKCRFLNMMILITCAVTTLQVSAVANTVQEVYHQKNNDKNCLEIAHMVLFFARDPQGISLEPRHKVLSNGMHKLTFIFDNTHAVREVLNKVNPSKGDGYTIQFDAQNKNLVLVVTYDPKKIEVSYGDYTTLDMKKGYIIRFFDHTLLSKMSNKESYILQTAASGIYWGTSSHKLLI